MLGEADNSAPMLVHTISQAQPESGTVRRVGHGISEKESLPGPIKLYQFEAEACAHSHEGKHGRLLLQPLVESRGGVDFLIDSQC